MNKHPSGPRQELPPASTAARPIHNPLDVIHEDHLRAREMCADLDHLERSDARAPELADRVLTFLKTDLPLHLEDEEEDLFPLLKRRCEPQDEIGKALKRLSSDHEHAAEDTPTVVAVLQAMTSGTGSAPEADRLALTQFAAHVRRHLLLENAIILPFAKLRLTNDDLETLRLRMLQRRGLAETQNAD